MRLGLRPRLGVWLAACGVLAAVLTGLYLYSRGQALLARDAERSLLETTERLGQHLAGAMRAASDDARMLSELDAARGATAGGAASEARKAALAETFHAVLRTNPQYFQLRYIGATHPGLELVRIDRDTQGTVRVPDQLLKSTTHVSYLSRARALGRGEVFVSKPGSDEEAGSRASFDRMVVYIAAPVAFEQGPPQGVVVIGVDMNRVVGELKETLAPTAKLFLTNEQGEVFVDLGGTASPGSEGSRQLRMRETLAAIQPLLRGDGRPVPARADFGMAETSSMPGAFVRLRFGAEADPRFVVLGIGQPSHEGHTLAAELGVTALHAVLALSAAAIALALVAARLLTRPLDRITRAIERFSSEQAMGTLPLERQDEIGALARGIDDMRRRIETATEELEQGRKRMAHMARHDGLTGLATRLVFIDRLEHAILATRRSGGCLAVLLMDLDRFKHINDTHGHEVGDQVLMQTARLMKSAVREVDTVARWGGDEFVILLEGMDEEHEARRVAQVLLDRFSRPMRVGELSLDLGSSIGISMYPRDGFDAAELIQRADEAMYLSKHRHGNRYSVFGSEGEVKA